MLVQVPLDRFEEYYNKISQDGLHLALANTYCLQLCPPVWAKDILGTQPTEFKITIDFIPPAASQDPTTKLAYKFDGHRGPKPVELPDPMFSRNLQEICQHTTVYKAITPEVEAITKENGETLENRRLLLTFEFNNPEYTTIGDDLKIYQKTEKAIVRVQPNRGLPHSCGPSSEHTLLVFC